jgi:hypothetical protein
MTRSTCNRAQTALTLHRVDAKMAIGDIRRAARRARYRGLRRHRDLHGQVSSLTKAGAPHA